ncbi:MAG TPA: hypothetical protein VKU87_08960 [Thermomicrobiaceae bacterium]|nr:hypothetical protein [Thermomicrobiaceae bacterium]
MNNPNIRPSAVATLLDVIDPSSQAAGAATSDWIDAQNYGALLALIQIGALGASAKVDAKLQQAQDAAGTGAKDIAGKAIAQLTKAGTNDNQQVAIDLFTNALDTANGYRYVQLSITVATAASLTAAVVLGFYASYGPGTPNTSLVQTV